MFVVVVILYTNIVSDFKLWSTTKRLLNAVMLLQGYSNDLRPVLRTCLWYRWECWACAPPANLRASGFGGSYKLTNMFWRQSFMPYRWVVIFCLSVWMLKFVYAGNIEYFLLTKQLWRLDMMTYKIVCKNWVRQVVIFYSREERILLKF